MGYLKSSKRPPPPPHTHTHTFLHMNPLPRNPGSARYPFNLQHSSFKHVLYLQSECSDFIWPFLRPYMGVIPNPKMVFIFPISCILAFIFPILIKYFLKCEGKGSFLKSQIKPLEWKPVWILIRWFHQKPADLKLQCFQKGINPGPAGQWWSIVNGIGEISWNQELC